MAAAPDCSLHTARREGGMEGGPHQEPSRWVPSVFCLEIYSKILILLLLLLLQPIIIIILIIA
jgi:hypothetical protein